MYAIETNSLTKMFGDKKALDSLELKIPSGSIYGFLGPNGAGKTTTLRIMLGLLDATSGDIRILGMTPSKAKRRIGYLPDVPAYYDWMTGAEYLTFAGELFGIRNIKPKVEELLKMTGLNGVTTKLAGYSRGMKQRLGIAQALVNDPDVIFLDEPTSALDPIGRKEVLECIAGLKGRTVIFSTHILNDVERVCDRVSIIDKGRLLIQEEMTALRERFSTQLYLLEVDDPVTFSEAVADQDWIDILERTGSSFKVQPMRGKRFEYELPKLAADKGLGLIRLEPIEPSLEDIFVKFVGEAHS